MAQNEDLHQQNIQKPQAKYPEPDLDQDWNNLKDIKIIIELYLSFWKRNAYF